MPQKRSDLPADRAHPVRILQMKTNNPGQSALLLLDVIAILDKFYIPYAVIGAFAASFYGIVRASLDADALIAIDDPRQIDQIRSVFEKRNLTVDYQKGDSQDPVKAVLRVQDTFKNRVDLLTGIRGMKGDVFDRTRKAEFLGSVVSVVSPEDFVAMKIFAGSPKDIQDASGVLNVSGDKINLSLLKDLAAGYGPSCIKALDKLLKIAGD